MVKVKICGITNLEDAKAAVSFGADAIGFIFYKKSPRYISPAKAKKIIAQLPPYIIPVGVFVNEKAPHLKRIIKACGLQAVQLHGDESPAFCRQFKKCMVIKAVRVKSAEDIKECKRYPVDAVLLDTYVPGTYGGTGKVFDWKSIARKKPRIPVIVSGGLNARNVARAIRTVKPYAVDVSSGVEYMPGKKSEKRLKQFFKNAQSR